MDKLLTDMNFMQFKLMNREDILGLVTNEDDDYFYVEHPHLILVREGVLTMVDWFPMSDQTLFKIPKIDIMMHVRITDQYKYNFIQLMQSKYNNLIDKSIDESIDDIDESIVLPTDRNIH